MAETPPAPRPAEPSRQPPADALKQGSDRPVPRGRKSLIDRVLHRPDPQSRWQDHDDVADRGRDPDRKKEMKESDNEVCVEVLLDRYETTINAEPNVRGFPQAQELDLWSKYLVEELAIAAGLDFQEPRADGGVRNILEESDSELAAYIYRNKAKLNLSHLSPQMRSAAFFVMKGTEWELSLALGKRGEFTAEPTAGTHLKGAGREGLKTMGQLAKLGTPWHDVPGLGRAALGLGDETAEAVRQIYQDVSLSGVVFAVKRFFNPRETADETRFMEQRLRQRHVTSYEMDSPGYKSRYAKLLESSGETEIYRRLFAAQRASMVYTEAATGKGIRDPEYKKLYDMTLDDDPDRFLTGNRFNRRTEYASSLRSILERNYPYARTLSDLREEDRVPALMQALRETITVVAKEHAEAVIKMGSERTFYETDVAEARGKLAAIKINEIHSPDEELAKYEQEAIDSWTPTHESYKSNDETLTAKNTLKAQNGKAISDLDESILSWGKVLADPTSSAGNRTTAQQRIDSLTESRKALVHTDTTLSTDILQFEKTLADAEAKLIGELQGTYTSPSDLAEIVAFVTGSKISDKSKLEGFIIMKKAAAAAKKREAGKATKLEQDSAKERQKIGDKVLDVIAEKRDEIAENFIGATSPESIAKLGDLERPEAFIKYLGLDKDAIGDERVLPPLRLARLMSYHLNMDIDPNDITEANLGGYWTNIYRNFCDNADGYARAKVVIEIYNDRFNAIREKLDPFTDVLHYERPRQVQELIPFRKDHAEGFEATLEKQGIFVGRDAVVDKVGGLALVAVNGQITMYRDETVGLPGSEHREYRVINGISGGGDLGIEADATGNKVLVTKPGETDEMTARNTLLTEYSRRSVMAKCSALTAGAALTIVDSNGINRIITKTAGPPPNALMVTAAPELAVLGLPALPLDQFVTASAATEFNLEEGGKLVLDKFRKRSEHLHALSHEKRSDSKDTGFQEHVVSVDNVPEEIIWVQEAPSSTNPFGNAVAIEFKGDQVYFEQRSYNLTDAKWEQSTYAIVGSTDARISLSDFLALTGTVDTGGLRIQMLASTFDLLTQMPPEQRKRLGFQKAGTDINVQDLPNGYNGRVTVEVDAEGEIVVNDVLAGMPRPLSEILNFAVYGNDGTAAPRYDQLPVVPATLYDQLNLRLQADVGAEFLRALHRRKTGK